MPFSHRKLTVCVTTSRLRPFLVRLRLGVGLVICFRVVRWRFNPLIANVQNRALGILINYLKPAARLRIIKKIFMLVVSEHVARPEAIAYQGARVLFLPERDLIIER